MTNPPPARAARPAGLTGAEALDNAIETTRPRGWWALAAIAVVLTIVAVWSVIATIPQRVSTSAVISTFQYTYDISAPAAGIVNFDNKLLGTVTAGQVLGTITPYGGGAAVPVVAAGAGAIKEGFVNVGQGVQAGEVLATVRTQPDPADGIDVFAYVPISDAITFVPGATVTVIATDVATSGSTALEAQVVSVGESPSTFDAIAVQAGSRSVAQDWVDQADGAPYRVVLNVAAWPEGPNQPSPGELVTIVNTYASAHPIQLLFGGG